ncbi:MAG: cadmium-translocating P-type ATPase, partial [Tenericutes bacterium HGW-Tenericutes-8]
MKHKVSVEGITCTNCALKIEEKLKKEPGLTQVSVNVIHQTITYESAKKIDHQALNEIIQTYEKDAKVRTHDAHDGHNHENHSVTLVLLVRIGLSVLLVLLAVWLKDYAIYFYLLSYVIIGYDVLIKAIKNILTGQMLDEHFLMGIATIGAFLINESFEAVLVMLFYQVGELFQSMAVNKSRKAIEDLIDFKVTEVLVEDNDALRTMHVEAVKTNQIMHVKPGELIPLDGIVVEGYSDIDSKHMTGESKYNQVGPNDIVSSGTVNVSGLLKIKVTKVYEESTTYKIIELMENALTHKGKTERFMTKFAKVYTPIVVLIAVLLVIIPSLLYGNFNEWLYRGLIFLVISCPCALVISIPLGFFGGLGLASKKGVLIKGSNYLEGLNDIDYVLFDKTGTLTQSKFTVKEIHDLQGDLIELMTLAEYYSTHPLKEAFDDSDIDTSRIKDFKNHPGKGIEVLIDGQRTLVGSVAFLKENGFEPVDAVSNYTKLHLAKGQPYKGYVLLEDQLKDEAYDVISYLKSHGYKTGILSGDNAEIVRDTAIKLGVDDFYFNMSPQGKLEQLKQLEKTHKVLYIGDGTNDALVLLEATLGASMGQMGSDIALESSDIVFM